MIKNVSKVAIVAAALVALPGMAQAGTATATGTATLTVINQCTVTGATVNLGSYTTSNTWANVGTALGSFNGANYTVGSLGQEYLNFGSVTCDSGAPYYTAGSNGQEYLNFGSITCDSAAPYTLTIKGTATGDAGAIKLTHNGKAATFMPGIKKLGGNLVADSNATFAGAGVQVWQTPVAGTGTGTAQALLGNVTLSFAGADTTALATDTLGAAGTASDTLTYTLNF